MGLSRNDNRPLEGEATKSVSRRAVLAAAGGILASASGGLAAFGQSASMALKDAAAKQGILYGSAFDHHALEKDPGLTALIARECAAITPTWEMKWKPTAPAPGKFTFRNADLLVDFAKTHGLKLRGHTLAWHRNVPQWAMEAIGGSNGHAIFESHIREVAEHFAGEVFEWDAANEAVEPVNHSPDGMRISFLYSGLGSNWVTDAFFTAHAAVPDTPLYYNEYGLSYANDYSEARREAVLGLLQRLKTQKAPVAGLGVQAHLVAGVPFDGTAFRRFLADVASLGLKIKLTEFDIDDTQIEGSTDVRDRAVADLALRYLETALDERAVCGVITWGLSDRNSDLNAPANVAHRGGVLSRCLPYDSNLTPKPFRVALERAFLNAPDRT